MQIGAIDGPFVENDSTERSVELSQPPASTPQAPQAAEPLAALASSPRNVSLSPGAGDPALLQPLGGAQPLGAIQLKRVAVAVDSALAGRSLPPGAQSAEKLKMGERQADGSQVSSESRDAREQQDDMAKQAKRKSARKDPPPFHGAKDNVIPLPVSRSEPEPRPAAEPSPSEADGARASVVPGRPRGRRHRRSSGIPPAHEAGVAAEAAHLVAPRGASTRVAESTPSPPFPNGGSLLGKSSSRTVPEAPADDDDHDDHRFFSQPPAPVSDSFAELDADDHDHPHTHGARRGMYVTLAIGLLGLLLIGGFLLYNKLLMPTPEELGSAPVALPTPDMMRAAPPIEPSPSKPEPAIEQPTVEAVQPAPEGAPTETAPSEQAPSEQAPSAPTEVAPAMEAAGEAAQREGALAVAEAPRVSGSAEGGAWRRRSALRRAGLPQGAGAQSGQLGGAQRAGHATT